MLAGMPNDIHAYFVHSYHVAPTDPAIACTTTEYGYPFVSSIW